MSSVSKVISCLDLVLLVIGGIFHLSISARAIGSNNKPEHEILWNGYFEGNEIMAGIVDTTKTNLYGTAGKLNVYIDKEVEPVEIWSLNSENVYFQKNSSLSIPPEMIISSNQIIDMNDYDFQGQEFVSNSYPMWTWDPVNSFFSTDYWNWFFFRNNLQYKEYNFIWTNRTLMNKKIY